MTAVNVKSTTNFLDWFIHFRSPSDIIKNHADYFKMEMTCFVCCFFTFIHAMRMGGRYRYLWFAVVLHGLFVEYVSYVLPDIDSFWHAQGIFMFLGQRLPLYIVLIYPVFIYTASVAIASSGMKWWARPFAVGLSVVILDLPYDILGIKNLFWTWHDTDPNIYDRHYWVPWTSYYFHATFACGFTIVFLGAHKLLAPSKDVYQYAGFFRETICCLLAGLLGFPLGVIQFVFIYHPLHDTYGIHTENCVMMLVVIFGAIIWMGDRSADRSSTGIKKSPALDEMITVVILWYTYFVYLVFTSKPEKNVVIGLHEPVGPCQETEPVQTPFGHVLSKRKYLCLEDYNEDIFNLHCSNETLETGQQWYTICGTPYDNHMEYIVTICTVCFLGLVWYWNMLRCSCHLAGSPRHHHYKHPKHE